MIKIAGARLSSPISRQPAQASPAADGTGIARSDGRPGLIVNFVFEVATRRKHPASALCVACIDGQDNTVRQRAENRVRRDNVKGFWIIKASSIRAISGVYGFAAMVT